ncbi:MAG TPA: hypothetical protein VLA09_01685, partial [Longimicrobiales bacterium]|nr:hypothetical protein [Longimicrobiales bacterium]
PDREEFCAWTTVQVCSSALSWSGALEISVDAATVSATGFSVEDIALRSSDGTEFRSQTIVTGEFTIGEVQVSLGSRTTPIEDVSLPAAVFPADASDIGTIDNPGGALDALTEADLKRVFYQAGFGLASILFNETIEIQRGDHEHVLDCGLISVTVLPTQLPLLQNTWSSCHFFPGLFVSGDFSLEWQEIDSDVLKLVMVLDGVAVLEGGLPTIELTGMVWTLERVPDSDPDLFHFRLSGELITPTASRTFSIEFVLDD